jgi:hypothetical protein
MKALADPGWIDGRNVRMDLRWHGDDINPARALASELVGRRQLREPKSHSEVRCGFLCVTRQVDEISFSRRIVDG